MADTFQRNSTAILSITLAIIFIWFGGIKFTQGGATGIEGLINNSPILSWVYGPFSVTSFAAILGAIEIIIGLLLLAGIANSKLGLLGALGGVVTFLVTLTFMFTTPGVVPEGASFPVLSGMPGEFLLKDLVLLGVSAVLVGIHGTTASASSD